MEIITFALFYAANVLIYVLYVFLMSAVSGLGLGLGLYSMKGWLERRKQRKLVKQAEKAANEEYKQQMGDVTPEAGAALAGAPA